MDSSRNSGSNSNTSYVVIIVVIIAILVITAGLKNSAVSCQNKPVNMTSSSHQRPSPILISSIQIASTRNNKTAAVLQSLNNVKPKWNPNNPRPHAVQRHPLLTHSTNNNTLKANEPIERSYLNGSRTLPSCQEIQVD